MGDLTQSLRHQPGLHGHVRISHFTFQFRLRHECGDAVHDDQVHACASDQCVHDGQGLFTAVRLRQDHVVAVASHLLGVQQVECVLCIDEGDGSTTLLHLGCVVQCQGRLSARFRSEHFHHTSTRQPSHAQGRVQQQRTRRNARDARQRCVACTHHRTSAEGGTKTSQSFFERVGAFFRGQADSVRTFHDGGRGLGGRCCTCGCRGTRST
mmetsp:Transcript_3626/g.22705  ORF Transcript_3626/g.22705 Transcript_3626/m.22705 type:complete len:210 (-) Transcript_3626:251-880(-)